MRPVQFLSRAFIDAFGITHPSAAQERKAAWFIIALLVGCVVAVVGFLLLALYL